MRRTAIIVAAGLQCLSYIHPIPIHITLWDGLAVPCRSVTHQNLNKENNSFSPLIGTRVLKNAEADKIRSRK